MKIKKKPVMQLPAEQQAVLTASLPELRRMAANVHWKFFFNSDDLCTREDLVQATLSRLYTARNYPPADTVQLMRWANVSMRNVALDLVGKAKMEREGARTYLREQEYHALVPATGEEKLAYLLRMARLHLRPVVNQVLLGYGLGHSGTQIAATLGIPKATVRHHFFQAKKHLRTLDLTAV
jgi:DNA-directed RNA polymerase specialized sigma24 family protein